MANVFLEAKKLQRKNPKLKWQAAIKKAAAEQRKKGKSGSVKKRKQTGTSNKKRDKQYKALPPGKRKSASGKTYYESRKNRSDMPGSLTGMVKQKLANALMAYEMAQTVGATKKAKVQVVKYRRILKSLTTKK
jgi:hypothetical protein